MDAVTLIFVIIISISIMAIAFGYSITLPSYSRDSYLSGWSVRDQQCWHRVLGEKIMWIGLIVLVVAIALGALLGIFRPVRYEYGAYEKIDVFHAQGRSFVMADGSYYEIDHDKYYWISSDYPGMFSQKGFSPFGLDVGTSFKIVDMEGEFY